MASSYRVDKEERDEDNVESERDGHEDGSQIPDHSGDGGTADPNAMQRASRSGEERANAKKVLLLLEIKERRMRTNCMRCQSFVLYLNAKCFN